MASDPPNRAAHATIAGFAYQFDLTTLTILSADNTDQIAVEGCEDVDILKDTTGEAVQCKYLEAAKYSLAGLRKPILPMLRAFANGQEWNYRLYVHYGDSIGLPETLSLTELKDCLTEKKRKSAVTVLHYQEFSDDVLTAFLARFTIQAGNSFDMQQKEVQAALCLALGGTPDDVRDLHYPNAVALVMDLAMRPALHDRMITRSVFLNNLNMRPAMYTRWHEEYVGLERFKGLLKRRIKAVDLLTPNKRRLIVLESPPSHSDGLISVVDLIGKLATTMYGPGKLSDAKPWTVVLDASENEVAVIKKDLIAAGVMPNDGFEHLLFSASLFDRDPLINTKKNSKVIEATSYDVRIVSAATYLAHRDEITPPTIAVSFAVASAREYVNHLNVQTLDIQGCHPENILDLLGGAK